MADVHATPRRHARGIPRALRFAAQSVTSTIIWALMRAQQRMDAYLAAVFARAWNASSFRTASGIHPLRNDDVSLLVFKPACYAAATSSPIPAIAPRRMPSKPSRTAMSASSESRL